MHHMIQQCDLLYTHTNLDLTMQPYMHLQISIIFKKNKITFFKGIYCINSLKHTKILKIDHKKEKLGLSNRNS